MMWRKCLHSFWFLVLGGPTDHAPGCPADRMWWGAALSNSSGKPRRFHEGQVNTDGDYREVQPWEPAGRYRWGPAATGSYHPGSKGLPPPKSQQVYLSATDSRHLGEEGKNVTTLQLTHRLPTTTRKSCIRNISSIFFFLPPPPKNNKCI